VLASPAARFGQVTENPIPADVRHLLHTAVRSIADLELLLQLRRDPGRSWTAPEAAKTLYLDPKATERMLFDLMARGFLTVSRVPPLAYQYSPRTAELRATIGRLADLYTTRRVTVMNLIFERPDESLRLFSDAFRLRKDE
jgi:hypothetical protein